MLAEWGTLSAVLAAGKRRLTKIAAGDEAAVAAVRRFGETMRHAMLVEVERRPLLHNWEHLNAYLRATMAHEAVETLRVLYLNVGHRLLCDELVVRGELDNVQVDRRAILHRAMDLGAAGLILAHNHPSGDPKPSRSDVEVTRRLMDAGLPLDICVYDHVVVGTSGIVSMRSKGLI